jgi:hypothetical protein
VGRKTCGDKLVNLLPDQPLYFCFKKHLVKAGLSLFANFLIELHGEGPLFFTYECRLLLMNAARFGPLSYNLLIRHSAQENWSILHIETRTVVEMSP